MLPLVQPLSDYLASLPASDDAERFHLSKCGERTSAPASLSNQFREILVEAGLVAPLPRGHRSTGKGRTGTRKASEISFHSLRHSAVTMLKAAGLSDVVRTRDRGTRERGNLAPIHAPSDGRSARRHAAVAGRNSDDARRAKRAPSHRANCEGHADAQTQMSKREGIGWQAGSQPQKLREFPEHEIKDVMEVARMLYALAPFKRELWGETGRWRSLARQAYDFLDRLSAACAEIQKSRSAMDAAYRRAEKRSAEAEKWPEIMPYEKAAREITRESHTRRALPKFEKFVFSMPRYFGDGVREASRQEICALIKGWKKNGIPRDWVEDLQIAHDKAVRIEREKREAQREREQAKTRKRKPRGARHDPKNKPVIREVLREIET